MKADLINVWGDDYTVAHNAWVSFGKEEGLGSDIASRRLITTKEERIIKFLARGMPLEEYEDLLADISEASSLDHLHRMITDWKRNPEHFAPFANGVGLQFYIEAPIPLMRQIFKHTVGFTQSEVSRRYVKDQPEVFYPEFRAMAENVKQGSSDTFIGDKIIGTTLNGNHYTVEGIYRAAAGMCLSIYKEMIAGGVAPEQARFILPQGMMTAARISGSLYGWARFYNHRKPGTHAQKDLEPIVSGIAKAASAHFPVSWRALTDYDY